MMPDERQDSHLVDRRTLLRGAAGVGLTAAAALLPACGSGAKRGAAIEGPPETPTFRVAKTPITCAATQAVASEFMKQEGFTDLQYVELGDPRDLFAKFAAGATDMILYPAPIAALRVDAGDPIVILGGVNSGCFQIVGSAAITSLRDFKGKTIVTGFSGSPDYVFLALTLANVGIDIQKDVRVIFDRAEESARLLAAGEVDGITALPPFSQALRTSGIGHVVLDSNMDRPWSQYLWNLPTVHREFMEKNPVATKRALRALFKGADLVAKDPERGARIMTDLGFIDETLYRATLEELRAIPHDVWRPYDPVDTLNFYSLRLREAGLIKSTPKQVISRGTDFRFLRELKQQLKEA
jgi:NitT/TauT family transport system substrate-binding protein